MNSGGLPASRKSRVGLQHGAKSLLRNMIRHTDTHNRMLEEAEMWQIHNRMKRRGCSSDEDDRKDKGSGFKEPKIENSFLFDDRRAVDSPSRSGHGKRRAHMDEEDRDMVLINGGSDRILGKHEKAQSSSTYWQRQLVKAEENDADRWGHGGFKELYPQDFDTDRSEDEQKKEEEKKLKKKAKKEKRKKKKADEKKKKSKDKKNGKKKRHHRKVDEDDGSSDDGRGKKSWKRSILDDFSDSDSGVESKDKGRGKKDSDKTHGSRWKRTWEKEKNLTKGEASFCYDHDEDRNGAFERKKRKRDRGDMSPEWKERSTSRLSKGACEQRKRGNDKQWSSAESDYSSGPKSEGKRSSYVKRRKEYSPKTDSDTESESSDRRRDGRKW